MARFRWKLRAAVYGSLVLGTASFIYLCTGMPGTSSAPTPHPNTRKHAALSAELKEVVGVLSTKFGSRNLDSPEVLEGAAQVLGARLQQAGAVQFRRELVKTPDGDAWNLIAEVEGLDASPPRKREEGFVLIGAHYDTAPETSGANDNGSGVAALLSLARRFSQRPPERDIRFVLFANEEPPYFQSRWMGSLVHAKGCRDRGEEIIAMLSLETLAYYSERDGSQRYPFPAGLFYPKVGNFVAFVSNTENRALVRSSIGTFRHAVPFPSEGAAFPDVIAGVGWSDHWSFYQMGYPALMVTDTAVYRDPNYHKPTDLIDHLDFNSLATVVIGLEQVIRRWASPVGP